MIHKDQGTRHVRKGASITAALIVVAVSGRRIPVHAEECVPFLRDLARPHCDSPNGNSCTTEKWC